MFSLLYLCIIGISKLVDGKLSENKTDGKRC